MVLLVVLGGFGWFWVVLGRFGWFWVVPCFSHYVGNANKLQEAVSNYTQTRILVWLQREAATFSF